MHVLGFLLGRSTFYREADGSGITSHQRRLEDRDEEIPRKCEQKEHPRRDLEAQKRSYWVVALEESIGDLLGGSRARSDEKLRGC